MTPLSFPKESTVKYVCWFDVHRPSEPLPSMCCQQHTFTWGPNCGHSLKMKNQLFCNRLMLNLKRYALHLFVFCLAGCVVVCWLVDYWVWGGFFGEGGGGGGGLFLVFVLPCFQQHLVGIQLDNCFTGFMTKHHSEQCAKFLVHCDHRSAVDMQPVTGIWN